MASPIRLRRRNDDKGVIFGITNVPNVQHDRKRIEEFATLLHVYMLIYILYLPLNYCN